MNKRHSIVLIVYTILAVVMTWPLVLHFGSSIPGVEGDSASFVWALGWTKTALVDLHVNPFRTDYVFYPLGGATQLLWAVSLIGLVSIPLQTLFGLIGAHNLLYLAATVLTAYGTFLLAEQVIEDRCPVAPSLGSSPLPPYQTFLVAQFVSMTARLARRSPLAPFTAGIVFAFAPLRQGYGMAFLNLYNTGLIPFYLLFVIRATRQRSWRMALVAGILLGLNAYIDFQIAAFLILLTALYAVAALIVASSRVDIRSLARPLRSLAPLWLLTGIVALAIAAPILILLANDFAIEGENYIRVFKLDYSEERSYDLASFFLPNARSSLYGNSPLKVVGINASERADDASPLSPDRQVFAGYIVLALAAYAVAKRWRQSRGWLLTAIVFMLLSMGPALHVVGRETNIPLPYLFLHEVPIFNNIRIPMRYGIMVYLALAILAALAIQQVRSTRQMPDVSQVLLNPMGAMLKPRQIIQRWLTWLIPIGILVEYAVLPYPLQLFSVPRVYEQIAQAPGDFTVLEIPSVYWRGAAATEVYQAFHHKRILRAYTNRIAPDLGEYFGLRATPVAVRSMRALEGLEPVGLQSWEVDEDKRERDKVLRFFDIRYAVVHRDQLKPVEVDNIDQYLREALGARVIADDGTVIGYELPVSRSTGDTVDIDLREIMGQMYAGRGWQFEYPPANWQGEFDFVWTRGARSEIYFVSPHTAAGQVVLHAYATTPHSATVLLNDEQIGRIELTPEWKDHELALPARLVKAGMNRLDLVFDKSLTETVGVTTIQIKEVDDGSQTSR